MVFLNLILCKLKNNIPLTKLAPVALLHIAHRSYIQIKILSLYIKYNGEFRLFGLMPVSSCLALEGGNLGLDPRFHGEDREWDNIFCGKILSVGY